MDHASELPSVSRQIVILNDDHITYCHISSWFYPFLPGLQWLEIISLSFARYCRRRHLFLEYRSARWKDPGGCRTTLDFMVSNWLEVSGSGYSGELSSLTVSGRQFTIAYASVRKALRYSSSSCDAWWLRRAGRMLCTVRIWHSRMPLMWLAWGTFILYKTQLQFLFRSSCLTFSLSSFYSACWNLFLGLNSSDELGHIGRQ